ncbi:folylpolyglutamate synthase/dihydrofolate synthase family protein [Phocaeicola abscessus]|uniref:bifunctional folylpolyglutamate synthase/dihydrofolate synthase n=1 Tax=Phocaeicola abscessus TaxID=555313 RepID=UPI0028EA1D6E|nr:folylpolyglutamate synthase/dihydrofolate synthase family protein [Phocaeicola abscessus]
MSYEEAIDYLFNSVPLFQHIGKDAYKEGLVNTQALDEYFGHPHRHFHTIHVAGTNGKGSCAHTLAAILQSAGYQTGLYTSPHLIDFRERIRVNGIPVSEEFVTDFVTTHRSFFTPLHPSFFELTTAMAFKYFSEQKVEVAVIEVGMGGRLDCTNIIHPDLSVITNISFDHMQFLGDTLVKIAGEKAGIIKKNTPAVVGETNGETKPVFMSKAREVSAPLTFAEEEQLLKSASIDESGYRIYQTADYPDLRGELGGLYQLRNTNTLLSVLRKLKEIGYTRIGERDVRTGFAHVAEMTGLMGRWQKLGDRPTMICDAGHNAGGFEYIAKQLKEQRYKTLRIVIGMVNDKDIDGILSLLPQEAVYYFTRADIQRALPERRLKAAAVEVGLKGDTYPDVASAVKAAKDEAADDDFIYVGGSCFVVADLLKNHLL